MSLKTEITFTSVLYRSLAYHALTRCRLRAKVLSGNTERQGLLRLQVDRNSVLILSPTEIWTFQVPPASYIARPRAEGRCNDSFKLSTVFDTTNCEIGDNHMSVMFFLHVSTFVRSSSGRIHKGRQLQRILLKEIYMITLQKSKQVEERKWKMIFYY
jgi:hypothetical protein